MSQYPVLIITALRMSRTIIMENRKSIEGMYCAPDEHGCPRLETLNPDAAPIWAQYGAALAMIDGALRLMGEPA